MARLRSPNYPAISLAEALARVKQVFEKEHRHWMPKDVLAKHMGYSGINGASLGAISAMQKYGLLEREADQYKVSDRSIAILHPRNEMEKSEAIMMAAREPALFADILNDFKGKPPSDDNLRSYLVRRNFNQSSLTGVIQAFRETMDLVSAESGGYSAASDDFQDDVPAPPMHQSPPFSSPIPRQPQPSPATAVSPFTVQMQMDRLVVSGTLTDRETVEKLIDYLNAAKGLLQPAPKKPGGDAPSASQEQTERE